jgi:HlyD family secretion protein
MAKAGLYKSKYLWLVVIILIAAMGYGGWRFYTAKADKPVYLYGTIEKGSLITQVSTTGTLQAVTTVTVGAQVSGKVVELHADFNDVVKKGQLLAKIDTSTLEVALSLAEASYKSSEISIKNDELNILVAQENLAKAKLDLAEKTRKLKQEKQLYADNLVSKDDLDTAQAAYDSAVASVRTSEYQLESAKSNRISDESRLSQSKANVDTAKLNLSYATIESPIAGTIISRSIELGQTLASNFSAPSLFTIAADLTKMQVNASIDEADVAKIKEGMDANFTVDAYSGQSFVGKIRQIRLSSATTQNVVTYSAIVDVDNSDLRLKPGMTATLKIVINRIDDVLKIPNSALRFRPTMTEEQGSAAFTRAGLQTQWAMYKSQVVATTAKNGSSTTVQTSATQTSRPSGSGGGGDKSGAPGAGAGMGSGRSGESSGRSGAPAGFGGAEGLGRRSRGTLVWKMGSDQQLLPVIIQTGTSDGSSTQIVDDGSFKEGDSVITGVEATASKTATTASTQQQQNQMMRNMGGMMGGMGGFSGGGMGGSRR